MLRSICNKKGVRMIEVLIAIFLTTMGIMALLSLQPRDGKQWQNQIIWDGHREF